MTGAAGPVLAAGSGPSPLWYATRATGVIAFVLLTVTVALGVAGTARFAPRGWPRVVSSGLHRNISLLAVGFVAVHVITTVADSYVSIGLVSAVVPFTTSYRPLWLSLGTVAFDLLLALIITSLLRDRLSYRTWRAVHWLAYASWPVALWHGLGTGTDSRLGWLLALDAACLAVVAGAAIWRLAASGGFAGKLPAAGAVAVVPLATAVFVAAGPLQPGWARRAGTPPRLLSTTVTRPGAVAGPGTAEARAAVLPLRGAPFRGRVSRMQAGGEVTITVRARTAGARPQPLRVVLRGTPSGPGVSLSGGSVRLGGGRGGYAGPVLSLSGTRLVAALRGPAGAARADIVLAVHGSTATGRITAQPGSGAEPGDGGQPGAAS